MVYIDFNTQLMECASIIKEKVELQDLRWRCIYEWKHSIRVGLNTIFKKKDPTCDRTIPPIVSPAANKYAQYLHNISSSNPKFYCHFFHFFHGLLASDECKKLETFLVKKYNDGDNNLNMFHVSYCIH